MNELIDRLSDGDVGLPGYTQEQLCAVADLTPRRATWLDALDKAGRETARIAALRSLAARGLVTPESAEAQSRRPEAQGSLSAVLTLRQTAPVTLVAERVGGGRTLAWTTWLAAPDVVLCERVNAGGMYRQDLRTLTRAAVALAGFVDPHAPAAGLSRRGVGDTAVETAVTASGEASGDRLELAITAAPGGVRVEAGNVVIADARPGLVALLTAAISQAALAGTAEQK